MRTIRRRFGELILLSVGALGLRSLLGYAWDVVGAGWRELGAPGPVVAVAGVLGCCSLCGLFVIALLDLRDDSDRGES